MNWQRDEQLTARAHVERHDPTYWAEHERARDDARRDAWLEAREGGRP